MDGASTIPDSRWDGAGTCITNERGSALGPVIVGDSLELSRMDGVSTIPRSRRDGAGRLHHATELSRRHRGGRRITAAMIPEERIILFDGVCNLCNGFVQFILVRDPQGKFRFASLQSASARRLLGASGPAETVVLIEAGGGRISSRRRRCASPAVCDFHGRFCSRWWLSHGLCAIGFTIGWRGIAIAGSANARPVCCPPRKCGGAF